MSVYLSVDFSLSEEMDSDTKNMIGVCKRQTACAKMVCYYSGCDFEDPQVDNVQKHVQREHHNGQKIKSTTVLFPCDGIGDESEE